MILDRDGAVAWLVLDRDATMNALSLVLLEELEAHLAELAADAGARVIAIRGGGRCFSAGADMGDFERIADETGRRRYLQRALQCLEAVVACPKPVLASVHGLALGGGLELARACDIVVSARDARFGLPEVGLGVLPAFALSRPHTGLAYLALSARRIDAAEAQRYGIVDLLADDPHAETSRLAREIAAHPPHAVQAVKRLLRGSVLDEAVAALGTPAHAEAVAAFRARVSR